LFAPAALLALVLAFFVPALAGAGWVALVCLGAEAVQNAFRGLFLPERDARLRCRSGVLRGLGGALTRFGTRFLLLPWEAFICASAVVTALWRMTVSGKNRLQWVTAAQAEGGVAVGPVWFSLGLGLALVLLAPGIGGKTVGLVWLASPLFAWSTGVEKRPHNALTEADRAFLHTSAQAMWGYFEALCTRSDHWLPPDNFQEQPPKGAARRTSPTNIGMAMAAALSALEMKLAREDTVVTLLENMMTTLEALPRWNGHLYNWYDTATCAPLNPAYVSTVDSGNLCACLLCVSQGMAAHGHPELARRMRALADGMDFAPLYDEKRRLFRIGLDPTADAPSPGHYDLMASEARLTSYLACARGQVPLRHWQALSRAQLSLDGWRGLASWSGSMFEYLMPELFLPLVPGSLLWETGRFCLYAQRRHGARQGVPWGNSESAFFALDGSLDYRYKAHGTGALALRRDMDSELVIAPYASFLALAVHPKAAVKNLRRLKKAGMFGRYGFYEALDKTPGRTGPDGQVVACFMSHHVGMSLCAVANCLESGVLRRYFMADAQLRAHQSLLAERVPLGGAVLRRSRSPLTPPPEPRPENTVFALSGAGFDPDAPAYFPLSNGVYSLLAGTDGTVRAQVEGLMLYEPDGFSLAVGDRLLTPSRSQSLFYPWQYNAGSLTFTANQQQEIFSVNLAVAAGERAELRRITAPAGELLSVSLAPVLAKKADFDAHPAFWRLGLEVTAKAGAVFVRRLYRGSLPEVWLCLYATVPLRLSSGTGYQMLTPVQIQATVPPGGCVTLALAFGRSRDDAWESAKRSLTGSAADMAGAMAALLGLKDKGLAGAMGLCAALAQGRTAGNPPPRPVLWQHGISGDLPLLYADATQDDLDPARRMLKRYALLTACGQSADLVLNTGEAGDYDKPRTQALRRYMDKYGLLPFENQPGGIHLVSDDALKQAAVALPLPVSDKAPALPGLPPAPQRGDAAPELTYLPGGAVAIQTPPLPPRAWSNVLSNGAFGYVAADCGTGFMWLENARECPVSPPVGDILATTGGEQLTFITALGRRSLFASGNGRDCRVVHGFGFTRWEQDFATVTAFVPLGYKARVMVIEGCSGGTVGWHLPLSMADNAADGACVVTSYENGCFQAQNRRSLYPDEVFRALARQKPMGYTGHTPSWLQGRWDSRVGAGLEPCFSMSFAGGQRLVLVCGYESEEVLRKLSQPERAAQELFRVQDSWRSCLSRVHVQTPDEDLNRMLNGWAAYQTLSCRLLGRTSLYQRGGAYGFRDQLQDVTNLLLVAPEKAREHLLLCCARQFQEGDVLHWWHETPQGAKGVRTRCSDDLLWLAWALCEYVEKTGDTALCHKTAPWLEAPPLTEQESDRYFTPPVTQEVSPVWRHAKAALDCVMARGAGSHGILLTGSGDWNDGMDKVGGESLWLTWFFVHTAGRFAELLNRLSLPESDRYGKAAAHYAQAAEGAWDGQWYLRGWWADGAPLGQAGASACAIDLLPQSWAAFCPQTDEARVKRALHACYDRLYDQAHGITKLFAPPFGDEGRDPGYIRACGPGFRENGGQYTHGAVWLASALLKQGMTQEGTQVLLNLLPAKHDPAHFGAEPYVMPADVSANDTHYGQALWSWYTGSAGWFFRVALEDLLGIHLKDGHLVVEPHLPEDWPGYDAEIAGRKITVRRGFVKIK
jgi:cyclic beta-1,2-glucan synthetase